MPISSVLVNVRDVAASVDFYTRHLRAQVVGEVTTDRAVLDFLTGTFELVRVGADAPESSWVPDDLQRGFRHVGFKVDSVDAYVSRLQADGVRFHLEPIEATGDVRITFFYDPDGTLLELVERDLQYTEVLDPDGVAAERALGVPDRPRLDHVAVTVAELEPTQKRYAPLGFGVIGRIAQPHDPRGFNIHYLKSGNTVLEVFTYDADKTVREPQLEAPGYVAAVLEGAQPDGETFREVGSRADRRVLADPDGLTLAG